MMNRVLENLLSEDYAIRVGFILPPGAMRLVLQRHSEQTAVTAAIRRGELTEVELREFVARCLAQFKPGALLPGDLALATLAVSLERIQTKYAEEFLTTLGKLHLQEMPLSSRITREVLRYRSELPRTQLRTMVFRRSSTILQKKHENGWKCDSMHTITRGIEC